MSIKMKSRKDFSNLEQNPKKLSINMPYKYKLVRESDGLIKRGTNIKWIDFNPDGTPKDSYDEPAIGRALLVDPRMSFTWLTTTITEIFYKKKNKIRFRTKNSIYVLEILKTKKTSI